VVESVWCKWLHCQKQSTCLMQSHQNRNGIHYRNWKVRNKVHLEAQQRITSKVILSKKSKAVSVTIPNFKLYYSDMPIKTVWYWHKNRYEDQWNRIGDPDMT
jgi:hypothetical protein